MRKIITPATISLLLFSLVFDAPAASTRPPATHAAQGAPAPAEAAWETYTFDGEEFSVALPEMPAFDHLSRLIKGERDKYEKVRLYGAYGNGIVYLMRAYDHPRRNEDLDFFARYHMQSQMYSGQSFELEFRRELQSGRFPGRQYAVKRDNTPEGIPTSSLHVYLTGRHAYALRAIGADDDHPDVKRFLSSFKLMERPAGRRVINEWGLAWRPPVVVSAAAPPPGEDRPVLDGRPAAGDPKVKGGEPAGNREGGAGVATPEGKTPEQIYKGRETTRKAAVVSKPQPLYTEEARRNQVTGTVRLRLVATASGKITNIVAVTLLPGGLTENSILAATHIKFVPAVKDGRRVSQYITIEYNYNIY
jgi:hypothetical protein